MTTVQKIIKYCALAFAAFLIITILSGIVSAIGIVGRIIDKNDNQPTTYAVGESQTFDSISSLEMDIESAYAYIKIGDEFMVDGNGENLSVTQEENTLIIEEDSDWFNKVEYDNYVTVFIPKDAVLDKVEISTGAGVIEIENLQANNLDMELGAGKATINQITVYNRAEIEGGAGKIEVKSSDLANLSMDIGAGSASVVANVTGNSNFDVGVGKLDLDLMGSEADYTIEVSKGIGDITVGDVSASDGTIIGTGPNKIDLDGGIGKINVDFQNII